MSVIITIDEVKESVTSKSEDGEVTLYTIYDEKGNVDRDKVVIDTNSTLPFVDGTIIEISDLQNMLKILKDNFH